MESPKLEIKLYDRVRLKSGEAASIVEILEPYVAYLADIDYEEDTETEMIRYEDIEKILW